MLNIVLLEPEIPQNTGNIARTCSATNVKLHLIEPLGFSLDEKYVRRAGLDYWDSVDIKIYKNIQEFFSLNMGGEFYYLTTKADKNYTDISYNTQQNIYLIFGKETKGIPEQLLMENQQRCIRIPMMGSARSLNLSNSVAIVTYEVLRQNSFKGLLKTGNFPKI